MGEVSLRPNFYDLSYRTASDFPGGVQAHTAARGVPMSTAPQPNVISLRLTKEQKAIVRGAIGRDGEALELQVEELEERITPRLAANHNETLLADR
jgi:hypothetical protein